MTVVHRAVIALAVLAAAGAAETHPRLLLTPERIAAIKACLDKPDHLVPECYGAIKARVDARHWYGGKESDPSTKSASRMAIEAACVHAISGDPAYAQAALRAILGWNDPRATSLHMGSGGLAFAFAYDWAAAAWSADERQQAQAKLLPMLDYLQKISKGPDDYNKTAVYRGAEIALTYALHEEAKHAARLEQAERILLGHVQDGYGDLGVFPEGPNYAAYAQGFCQPGYAVLRQFGAGARIDAVLAQRPIWRWMLYSGEFIGDTYRGFLQSGVAGKNGYNEGWASATFANVPAAELPHYLWWYDRHMGRLSPGPAAQKYDNDKGASPFALACYPLDAVASDPTGVLPVAVQDSRIGFGFFRNRWRDRDDILISLAGDREHSGRGWDQNEALQLQLAAHGSRYFLGPDKQRDSKLFTTLLIDGKGPGAVNGKLDGSWDHFAATPRGGYAIAGGGAAYAKLKVQAQRHLAVDFDGPEQNTALLGCLDRIQADASHTYAWNAYLDENVNVETGTDQRRACATITGAGGSLRLWVLHPASASIAASGRNLSITAQGQDAELWLAILAVPAGTNVAAQIGGEGLASTLRVAGRELRYDAAADRQLIAAR
jgi:hypothetical protein